VGSKVLARETLRALRKNVLERNGKTMGGGDVTRKMKLLKKQRYWVFGDLNNRGSEGKKRMRTVGNVELSSEAFLSVVKRGG
jgi:translation elongation factor EF-4